MTGQKHVERLVAASKAYDLTSYQQAVHFVLKNWPPWKALLLSFVVAVRGTPPLVKTDHCSGHILPREESLHLDSAVTRLQYVFKLCVVCVCKVLSHWGWQSQSRGSVADTVLRMIFVQVSFSVPTCKRAPTQDTVFEKLKHSLSDSLCVCFD
jgi:hypothetical protein